MLYTRIQLILIEDFPVMDMTQNRIHIIDRWIHREKVTPAAIVAVIREAIEDEYLTGVVFKSASVKWGNTKWNGRGAGWINETVKIKELLNKPAQLM